MSRHLLAGLIFAGSTLALPPLAAFGDGGRDRDEVTKLGSLPSGLRSLFAGISKLSETSSPSSSCDWFDEISIKSLDTTMILGCMSSNQSDIGDVERAHIGLRERTNIGVETRGKLQN